MMMAAARLLELERRHPDRTPVIITYDGAKHKLLVPTDMLVGQLLYVLRKRVQLEAKHAIFLMRDGCLLPGSLLVTQLERSPGEALELTAHRENTFGGGCFYAGGVAAALFAREIGLRRQRGPHRWARVEAGLDERLWVCEWCFEEL